MYFQKNNIKELQYLYLDDLLDYSNHVLRIFNNDSRNYIEFYIAGKQTINQYNKYEAKYKKQVGNLDLDLVSGQFKFNLFNEHSSIFLRDLLGSYIVTTYNNISLILMEI